MANQNLATKKEHLISYNEHGLFWDKEGKVILVNYPDLIIWLTENGYYKYGNELVKVTDNIVRIIKVEDLKATFLEMIEPEVKKLFYEKVKTIFDPKGGLMADIKWLEPKFIKDTKTQTWLFFKNTAVCIHPKAIDLIEYSSLDGYIWESSVVNRDFSIASFAGSDAEQFVTILGGQDYDILCRILGYNLSRYKDPTFMPATVLNEDIDAADEGQSNGRSGKGLLTQFISKFRKTLPFDGKSFNSEKTHKFQNLTIDTDIISIQDVKRNFPFDDLFSLITDGATAEPKNKPEILIPFEDSPKYIIQSNYIVGGSDGSSLDRKLVFSVVKYFSHAKRPIDVFHRQFFTEWDAIEWLRFDNFMAYCAQLFLTDIGHKQIRQETVNNKERQIKSDTNPSFVDMMDSILASRFIEFAPAILVQNGVFDYDRWAANMSQRTALPELFLTIDRDKLYEKTVVATKKKLLGPNTPVIWLKSWADSRGIAIDTRFGINKVILVKDMGGDDGAVATVKAYDDDLPF